MKWPFVLRSTYDALSALNDSHATKIADLEYRLDKSDDLVHSLREKITKLEADLLIAQKNDKRDPATGKYTK